MSGGGRPRRGWHLPWTVAIVLLAGVGVLLAWAFQGRTERDGDDARDPSAPRAGARPTPGQGVVTLDPPAQRRIALQVEPLLAAVREPEVVAYGVLREDPAQSFVLRAPLAGQIRRLPGRAFPAVGDSVADGEVVGLIDPQFAAMQNVDLVSRLATAHADLAAARASLGAARAALDRTRTLNAENKIASDRALEEALVRAQTEEARLGALTETVRTLESALKGTGGPGGAQALVAERGGEVIDVLAQLGETVESGQAILRLSRLDRLLARLTLPFGQPVDPALRVARIVAFGDEARVLRGERVAQALTADQAPRGQALVFRVARGAALLRPGQPITAYLPVRGASRAGVIVPRAAVVRSGGTAWVYVQAGDDAFARRAVSLDQPTEQGWFVTAGLTAGERVVTAGAQTLLSEEFKARIPIADEPNDR